MPNGLDQEILGLYLELLKQKVKDQYKGHQDYHLILDSIDSRFPMTAGKVNVQKQDRHGNIYTVTYHVKVKDDLGNIIESPDQLGGQCMKGEIVKKGHIFTCMECGELFCRRHVAFVDDDPEKPLCRYGFRKWEGCYVQHAKKYSTGVSEHDLTKLKKHIEKAKLEAELRAVQAGQIPIEGSPELLGIPGETRKVLPAPQKRGLLGGIKPYSIRCGNPRCERKIKLVDITCPNCRRSITISSGMPLSCPMCGEPITQIECPYCEAVNQL
jgi:hypothetical protein